VPSLKSITENLARAEREFLTAADRVPAGQWKTRPAEDRWSAAELVCHLIMVERAIIKGTDRLLQGPPKRRPLLKGFHIPMAIVETRLIRRKSPIPLDPGMVGQKTDMLDKLREVRAQTQAFMEKTQGKDLRLYHMPHPFLGTLNTYEWLQLIASHELRHTKQMREIAGFLPKTVAVLQK